MQSIWLMISLAIILLDGYTNEVQDFLDKEFSLKAQGLRNLRNSRDKVATTPCCMSNLCKYVSSI